MGCYSSRMPLPKLNIRVSSTARPINPRDIFNSLTLRGAVENLWAPQGEALDDWFQKRISPDAIIEMPTGGGKTLVGLLAAQSIVNETRGKVLYVCPTKQLVQQTMARAAELGLPVASYEGGIVAKWSGEETFRRSEGPCITNYAAAFHANSVFRNEELAAVVLDDSHVAVSEMRGRFTLRIEQGHDAYMPIVDLFREHFAKRGRSSSLEAATAGDSMALLFVPAFEFAARSTAVAAVLKRVGIAQDKRAKWPWMYLEEKLDRCFLVFGPNGIEIAPAIPPVHAVPVYRNAAKRLFLTATLPSQLELARVFGLDVAVPCVRPSGKLGTAQRLVCFVDGEDSTEHRKGAAELISNRKACIVVTSEQGKDKWPHAERFTSDAGQAGIDAFANDRTVRHLLLVARFDGIDLPGDACRVLVLDGLPRGTFLIDRFVLESVRVRELRASVTATRIVQALGRIFRSNTDHGVVLLVGAELHSWLKDPNFRAFLPPLLQQQVLLGLALRDKVDAGEVSFEQLAAGLLEAESEWDSLYAHGIAQEVSSSPPASEQLRTACLGEHLGYRDLWDGNYTKAATHFHAAADLAELVDETLAGWLAHLEGFALQRAGNSAAAATAYQRAASRRAEFGWPTVSAGAHLMPSEPVRVSSQAKCLSRLLAQPIAFDSRLRKAVDGLNYEAAPALVEESLKVLGELLGLESSRPEKLRGATTTLDVLWVNPGHPSCAAFEAKTGKKETGMYTKEDIGQCHDHLQWLRSTRPKETTVFQHIVGRKLRIADDTNPPPDLQVTPLESFVELARVLRAAADAVASDSGPDREQVAERHLRAFGLSWPKCIDQLGSTLCSDLKGTPPTDSER